MNIVRKLHQSAFLKHNAVFFIGSVLVGGLNYVFYPVLGRLMTPADFGEVQVLVSLFLQFTIFLNVLSMITITITANYDDKTKAYRTIFELEKLASYIALGILVISIVGGQFFAEVLNFTSTVPFVALALAILVSIPLTFRSAYARGEKCFGVASLSQLIGAGVKIVLSVGLVVLGLGVTGAIGGIVLAQFIAFLYAARMAARIGFSRPSDTSYKTPPDFKTILPELRFAGAVFTALLAVTLMMSIDVIIVKYYFDAHTAGLYAGIATVARIIFFLTTPVAQVLMPHVKTTQSRQKNRSLLLKSLGLTVLSGGSVTLICMLFPQFVTTILMGDVYSKYAHLLPPLASSVLIIAVINLIFMFFLSLRQKSISIIGIIGFVVLSGLLFIWHSTLHAVVYSMLLGSIFTLCATGIYVLVSLKRGGRDAAKDDFDRHPDL